MPSSRADIAKMALPTGVRAGSVVGRGGHNVKWLHFNSGGAHITVNDTGVVIRAKNDTVRERAVLLVRRQLEAAAKLANQTDPSPVRFDYVLLESAFGSDPLVRFSIRNDEAARVTGHKDKLYELVPETSAPSYGDLEACNDACLNAGPPVQQNSVVTLCNTRRLVHRDQDWDRDQDPESGEKNECGDNCFRFHACLSSSKGRPELILSPAVHGLAEAALSAAARGLALKLRFKLGKTLFRNLGPRAGKVALSVNELQGSGAGRGACHPTFSGYVPPGAAAAVVSWLTCHLGFSLVESKTKATFHVINQELNVHATVALAMDRGDHSTAVLRKVTAGSTKSHTITLLNAPEQLDLRLKLITQHREQQGQAADADAAATARRIAAAVRCDGFEGFMRSKRGLPRNRHLEYARRKTKSVYEGRFRGDCGSGSQLLRISVMEVLDGSGPHCEISGCLPEVDALMRQLLAQTPAGQASKISWKGDGGAPGAAPGSPSGVSEEWASKPLLFLTTMLAEINDIADKAAQA